MKWKFSGIFHYSSFKITLHRYEKNHFRYLNMCILSSCLWFALCREILCPTAFRGMGESSLEISSSIPEWNISNLLPSDSFSNLSPLIYKPISLSGTSWPIPSIVIRLSHPLCPPHSDESWFSSKVPCSAFSTPLAPLTKLYSKDQSKAAVLLRGERKRWEERHQGGLNGDW